MNIQIERWENIAKKGFHPTVIYDIGAFQGRWSESMQKVFPDAEFFLFEANEDNEVHLSNHKFKYFIETLGEKDNEELILYCNNEPNSGESVFLEQTCFYQEERLIKRPVKTRTLTSLIEEHSLPIPNLIKIDVQGSEHSIIRGSKSFISLSEAILIEASFIQYNKGAGIIHETFDLMNYLGFHAVDIIDLIFLGSGELCQADILFIKKYSPFFKKPPFA